MCGICGIVSPNGAKRSDLQVMCDVIAHRGPDDDGYYCNGQAGLGMRRLSIIDLDGGHQPISNEDQTIWIVFNGEIYNYKSLRRELEDLGHHFKTNTDTEVIVHFYEEMGARCVEKLNGMFAFAIWDERRQLLFLARDRLGQKPLFYTQVGESFLFSSEVKSLLASGQVERNVDFESVHHYLSLRFIPPPNTMIEKVEKLAPGHILIYQNGKKRISRYWNLSFHDKQYLSEDDFVDALKIKLEQVVEAHLVSDVPVGAFLSGGMDSSMIVALMARVSSEPFKSFSIGVSEQDFNELPYARLVADYCSTNHVEECVEANLIRLLPRIIWHLDEPSDPIAACTFHAAALAARHVKVVLGGDGGDELFAGFDRYLGVQYVDRYNVIPSLIHQRVFGPILDVVPDSFTYKSFTQKLRWLNRIAASQDAGEGYAEATTFFRFNQDEKQALYGDGLWHKVGHLNSADIIMRQFNSDNAEDPLDRMLYADFMTRLPEHSLMLTDRMTMAHSLEARSPYLDHTLVELLASYPSKMKIKNGELKYVLRKLAAEYLPQRIVDRDKQGFMFPIAYWFKNELYEFVKQALLDSFFIREGIFKRDAVLDLIEEHRNNKVDNHVRLWMLINLHLWYQIYIEQQELSHVEEQMMVYRSK